MCICFRIFLTNLCLLNNFYARFYVFAVLKSKRIINQNIDLPKAPSDKNTDRLTRLEETEYRNISKSFHGHEHQSKIINFSVMH